MAGKIVVTGRTALKPGTLVDEAAEISLLEPPPFVGRGGVKLAHALDWFHLDVSGWVVADIGASTGGFTDCLLQRGARRVYAVDVGYGQMDYRLRQDERVVTMERVNARYPFTLPEKMNLVTLDLSFISLRKVIPVVSGLLGEGGGMLALVKPQFEAKRGEVGRGGVIKDPLLQAEVLGRFFSWAIEQGYRLKNMVAAPILGAEGNQEFLVLLELT